MIFELKTKNKFQFFIIKIKNELFKDMTEEQLNRKIDLCNENLKILSKIDPHMIRSIIKQKGTEFLPQTLIF